MEQPLSSEKYTVDRFLLKERVKIEELFIDSKLCTLTGCKSYHLHVHRTRREMMCTIAVCLLNNNQGSWNLPFLFPCVCAQREILKLRDGGEVGLDWNHACCVVPGKVSMKTRHVERNPVVLILPGLTGCSAQFYSRCLVTELAKAGLCCVVFNNRGLGGVQLKVKIWSTCTVTDSYFLRARGWQILR
jgi:predicted alpha/beta-fold hydrolase